MEKVNSKQAHNSCLRRGSRLPKPCGGQVGRLVGRIFVLGVLGGVIIALTTALPQIALAQGAVVNAGHTTSITGSSVTPTHSEGDIIYLFAATDGRRADGHANPVLQGTALAWDNDYASGWTIIKNASNDFEMLYSGGDGKVDHGIGYATSSDGINWTKDANNPVYHKNDGIAWRDNRTYTPPVIKDGSTYKTWFTGKSTTGSNYSIGYATGALQDPTEKWVDQAGGSNSNGGDTETNAYATLQYAINNSNPGNETTQSIIHVKDGTYETTDQTNKGGYSTAILIKNLDYLTIQAVSGHKPKVMPGTAADIVSISIDSCDHLVIDNIDSDQTTAQFDNWHVWDSDDLTVRNSTFEGGEDGIDFNTGMNTALIENNTFQNITTGNGDEVLDFTDGACTNVTIQDNMFDYNYRQITLDNGDSNFVIRRNIMDGTNSEEAIRLIGASDILIENNVIMNNRQQGVYIDNGCSNITIQHNTFFNNDQEPESGGNGEIRTKVHTSDIIIKNNILLGNGSNPAFETSVTSLPGEDYNLVYNTSNIVTFTFGSNTITGHDPSFYSTSSGSEDFHLHDNSYAIGAGTNLGVSTDIEENSRETPPDIGAYENSLDAPVPVTTVWVDNDYTEGNCGEHIWCVDAFDNIQYGIDGVAEGGKVYVADGTYSEYITIGKSLTLQAGSSPTIDGGGSGTAVTIDASNVIIAGLTIQNAVTGVFVSSGSINELHFNNILNNTTCGLKNTSGNLVDVEYNWWGSANGPEQDGANDVMENVDATPWLDDEVGDFKKVAIQTKTNIGPSGGQVQVTITTGGDASNYLDVYQVGSLSGTPVTDETFTGTGCDKRSNIVWGIKKTGTVAATLVFDYSGQPGVSNASAIEILKRDNAQDSTWALVDETSRYDEAKTITTNVVDFSEYALGAKSDNSLPVELSTFTATAGDGQVTLEWATESEIENLGFNIYRSQNHNDQLSMINDQLIPGAGNSSQRHEYEYVDKDLTNGVTYWYKLEDVDYSGNTELHGSVSATPVKRAATKEFRLYPNYPNPFNSITTISFDLSEDGFVELSFYNMRGEKVATLLKGNQEAGSYKMKWDGRDQQGEILSSGIYFLSIATGSYCKTDKMIFIR